MLFSSVVSYAKSFCNLGVMVTLLATECTIDARTETHNWSKVKRPGEKVLFWDRRSDTAFDTGIIDKTMLFLHYIAR